MSVMDAIATAVGVFVVSAYISSMVSSGGASAERKVQETQELSDQVEELEAEIRKVRLRGTL